MVTPINKPWMDNPEAKADVESDIAFLASDDASYITGQTVFPCGVLTLYPEFRVSWSSSE